MIRAVALLALVACEGKKDVPPAAGSGSGSSTNPVQAAGFTAEPSQAEAHLAFVIDEISPHQAPSDAPPWHVTGGAFAYFTAHLAADPTATFVFGVPEEPTHLSADGWLVPTTSDAGARIVAAYAKTFSVPVPDVVPGAKLAPLPIQLAVIAKNTGKDDGFTGTGTWSAYKWFCDADDVDGAEVFFNVSLVDQQGEWSEKGAEYDTDVARCLAIALRDGMPPSRTSANDPTLAVAGPSVMPGKQIAPETAHVISAMKPRIVFMADDEKQSSVTTVALPSGAVSTLYQTTDMVLGGDCGAGVCALAVIDRGRTNARVVILDGTKTTTVKLSPPPQAIASVSPDGKWIIAHTEVGLAAIDVKTQRITHLAQLKTNGTIDNVEQWTDKPGVVLIRREISGDTTATGTWDVKTTGTLALAPTVAARPLRSPDGAREITIADTGAVTVAAGATARTFTLHRHDRGARTPTCCTWIDNRWLLMVTERENVWIDTDALKVSLLPGGEGHTMVPVEGAHLAAVQDGDGPWHLATIAPPP